MPLMNEEIDILYDIDNETVINYDNETYEYH
jgi:hypothetical protein